MKVRSFGFGGETRLSTVRLARAVVIAVTIGLAFLQTRGSRHFSASALIAGVPVLPSERYRCLFATFDAIDSDIEDTEFAADAVRSGEACAVGCSARESTIQ